MRVVALNLNPAAREPPRVVPGHVHLKDLGQMVAREVEIDDEEDEFAQYADLDGMYDEPTGDIPMPPVAPVNKTTLFVKSNIKYLLKFKLKLQSLLDFHNFLLKHFLSSSLQFQ